MGQVKLGQAKHGQVKLLTHSINLGTTSWNDEIAKEMSSSNQNLATVEVETDSGSFEDTDGSSDKDQGESDLAPLVKQEKGKSHRIGKTNASLEKKYVKRKVNTADKCRIANVRPIMKA